MTLAHWHHAVMEPVNSEVGKFRFSPTPEPTRMAAKSTNLSLMMLIGLDEIITLDDICKRNSTLAIRWLCEDANIIEIRDYLFAVVECGGDCENAYKTFQNMIEEYWREKGQNTAVIPNLAGKD